MTSPDGTPCEMSGPHRHQPTPAVVVMPGGTKLCGECAVTMLRQALEAGCDFHASPIAQPAVTPMTATPLLPEPADVDTIQARWHLAMHDDDAAAAGRLVHKDVPALIRDLTVCRRLLRDVEAERDRLAEQVQQAQDLMASKSRGDGNDAVRYLIDHDELGRALDGGAS